LAILHEEIEVVLDCVLLGLSTRTTFAVTWIFSIVLFSVTLLAPSMSTVFMTSSVIGGGNDFLIFLLLLHGRQYWLALGALGHVFSAVVVFTEVIKNFGVIPYNFLIFLGLSAHVGFTVMGILSQTEKLDSYDEPSGNPLAGVKFTVRTFLTLVGYSLVGSTIITLVLSYVAPGSS